MWVLPRPCVGARECERVGGRPALPPESMHGLAEADLSQRVAADRSLYARRVLRVCRLQCACCIATFCPVAVLHRYVRPLHVGVVALARSHVVCGLPPLSLRTQWFRRERRGAADLPALRRRWLGVRPCVLGVLHTAARRRRQVITLLNTSAANYFGLEDSTVDIIDTFGTSQRIFEGRLDAEHTPSAAQSATNALTAAPARAAHAACIRRAASERSLAAISESCRSREPPRTRRRRACRTSRVRCCLCCSAWHVAHRG
jgi:hypothetical protein